MKTNLKRIFSMALALVLVLGIFPAAALAAEPSAPAAPLTEGSYQVPVLSLTSGAPIPAVKKAFAKAFGESIRLDVDAQGNMTATILPVHMVVDMGVSGAYHCNVLSIQGATVLETRTEKVTPTFGKPKVTQDIEVPAKLTVPMPVPTAENGYVFTITVDFMNSFLGGGLEKDHPTDVTLMLDFANTVNLDQKAAAAVDAQIEALGEISLKKETLVLAARMAYDALTDAQKALVTKLDVLVAAEKTIFNLKTTCNLTVGSYQVPVYSLVSGAPLPAVQQAFAKAFGESIRLDVDAQGNMTATILPVHMVVDMEAMGAYHCNVLSVKGATVLETRTEKVTPTFGQADATQDIEVPAKLTVPMPEATAENGYVFTITVDFMNSFLGGGLEKDYPTDVTLTLDFSQAVRVENPLDGNYYVDITLCKEGKDAPSMGNSAFENNPKALVTVENGLVTKVQMGSNPVRMGTFTSAITVMKVAGADVTATELVDFETKNQDQVLGSYKYLQGFWFQMPQEAQPEELSGATFAPVTFMVPDTPMGAKELPARLKFNWDSKARTEDTVLVTSGVPGGTTVTDVILEDPITDITLKTTSDVLAPTAKLHVTRCARDADYQAAQKALNKLDKYFDLYKVVVTLGEEQAVPSQGVTLSIPCGQDGLTVYRVNPDGTKVAIRGTVENGKYVFKTSKLGLFAVMGNDRIHFTDVAENYWAADYIDFAVNHGLFYGTSQTTFEPSETMSRGMFVTVLGRLCGVDRNGNRETPFTDVDSSVYYAPYIAWAVENGIVYGTSETTFEPNASVTRQDMAVFLYRYCQKNGLELNKTEEVSFDDVSAISPYAREKVQAVCEAKLLFGVSANEFAPQEEASRAQVAALLMRLVRAYGF